MHHLQIIRTCLPSQSLEEQTNKKETIQRISYHSCFWCIRRISAIIDLEKGRDRWEATSQHVAPSRIIVELAHQRQQLVAWVGTGVGHETSQLAVSRRNGLQLSLYQSWTEIDWRVATVQLDLRDGRTRLNYIQVLPRCADVRFA